MTRRIISSLIAGALCMMALPAMASAASGFAADGYPAVISGEPDPTAEVLSLPGYGNVNCDGAFLSGELVAASEQLPVNAAGANCYSFGSKAPVEMNGCQFVLNPGSESFDIAPAGCGPIKVGLYGCNVSIGSQSDLDASYTNVEAGESASVALQAEATGLNYTFESGAMCKKGSHTNGGYDGAWELDADGGSTALRVEDIAVGAYVTGEESATPSEQPRIEAEQYPVRLFGDQTASAPWQLTVGGGTVQCDSVHLESSIGQPRNAFTAAAEFEDCTVAGIGSTVDMNSCDFEFQLLNAGPPYAATTGVVCSKTGDAIEFISPICTVKVGAQAGLSGIAVSNTGEGVDRGFGMEHDVKGVEHEVVKHNFFCPLPAGSFPYGTIEGELEWRGLQ